MKASAGKVRKAVIPAAGFGSRFFPLTKAQPKEMLPVLDKPAIQYAVEEAFSSGIEDILIITGKGKRAIEDHFDRDFELETKLKEKGRYYLLKEIERIGNFPNIHYIRQKEPRGLGDAILYAEKHIDEEPFAVLLGDDIIKSRTPCIKQLMKIYREARSSIIAMEFIPREKIQFYGMIVGKKINNNIIQIKKLVEKPSIEKASSNLGIVGRYILTPEIFECLKKTKKDRSGEIQLTDGLNILLKKQKIYGYEFEGRRYDIGNIPSWIKANIEFAYEHKRYSKELNEIIRLVK